MAAAAVASMPDGGVDGQFDVLIEAREAIAGSFRRWPDTLIEMIDALACSGRPVISPAWLTLEPELRRGYGSVYQALETPDAIDAGRLRDALTAAAVGRGRPPRFAVDVTPWPRAEADKTPDRSMVRPAGSGSGVATAGWPVLTTAHVGQERSSAAIGVDTRILQAGENVNTAAAGQIRAVAEAVPADAGVPMFLLDSGFCPIYLTQQVADTVQIVVRLRKDRVFYTRAEPQRVRGRNAKHGHRFKLSDSATHHDPDDEMAYTIDAADGGVITVTTRYWHRLHPAPRPRRKWEGTDIVEGTVCHQVTTWPCGYTQGWWLWWAGPPDSFDAHDVSRSYPFRFSIEHMFKSYKQLGWLAYTPISVAAAENWTKIMTATHAQLVLARDVVSDYRLPWDQPGPATPARVQRVFRRIHTRLPRLASAPKYSRPGRGRPPGVNNFTRRPNQPVHRKGRKPNTGHPKGKRLRLEPGHETATP